MTSVFNKISAIILFPFIDSMAKSFLFFLLYSFSLVASVAQNDPNSIPIGTNLQRRLVSWAETRGINEKYFTTEGKDPNWVLRFDGSQMKGNYNALWTTFAAHPNVPLYKSASVTSEKLGTLTPLVTYVVVRKSGGEYHKGFVELMEYNYSALNFSDPNAITVAYPCRRFGWAKASDLVLWDYALKDESGFNIKFLAISDLSTPGQLSRTDAKDEKNKMYFYDSPELTKRNGQAVPILSFLFLYKIEKNKKGEEVYLIGRKEVIEGDQPDEVILGWSDLNLLKRWPGRRALEPNTAKLASEERSSIKFQYNLKFKDAPDKLIPFPDPSGSRWPPERRRIIDMSPYTMGELNTRSTAEVAFIYNPTKKWGEQAKEDEAKLEAINEGIKSLRKIRLVLVVDGSEAMMLYKEQINKAFENLKQKIEEGANNNFQYSYGAVIYRDNVVGGAAPIEEIQFTDDASSFIGSLGKVNFSNKDKRQGDQNLLDGLDRAMGFFQGTQKKGAERVASNFIFVLGAGGDQSANAEAKINKLATKVRDNNVSIISNQFYNNEDDYGYSMFSLQIQEVMRKAIQGIAGSEKVDFTKKTANLFAVGYPTESPLAAQVFSADPGLLPSPDAFFQSIGVAFSNIQSNISKLIIEYQNSAEGLDTGTGAALKRLCEQNPNFCPSFNPDDKLDLMIRGTIDLNDSRLTNTPYARSILFTSNEFERFKRFLTEVSQSIEAGDKLKDQVYNAVKDFIALSMGKKESSNKDVVEFILKKNGSQLIERFVGYSPQSPFLKNLNRLEDIKIKNIGEVINFQVEVRRVLRKLESPDFKTSSEFQSSESNFYWCLVSDLL